MSIDRHIAISGLQSIPVLQEMFNAMAQGKEWRVVYTPNAGGLKTEWRLRNYEVMSAKEPEEEITLDEAALDMHMKIMAKGRGVRTLNEWVRIPEETLAALPGFSTKSITLYKRDLADIGNHYPGVPLGTVLPYRPVGVPDVRRQYFSDIVTRRNVIIVGPYAQQFVAMERMASPSNG